MGSNRIRSKSSNIPIENINLSDLFVGLVNVYDVYTVKITDGAKLKAFITSGKYSMFMAEYDKSLMDCGVSCSKKDRELKLLNSIKKYNIGIGLFEQIDGNWNELSMNPENPDSTPVKTPCF
jgi:hypothetical protein